jgi:DNA-binding NtrC family response regulator
MQPTITALLVHDRPEPMGFIRRALEAQDIKTHSVRTCREAHESLWGHQSPHLVLVDPRLPDGSWDDIVVSAAAAPSRANVIVVSDVVDMALYLESVQRGAFDFIVPPMSMPDFTYVVRSAVANALQRRGSSVQSPQPRS